MRLSIHSTLHELPPEVDLILQNEAHRGQRTTFILRIIIAALGIASAFAVSESNTTQNLLITIGMGFGYLIFALIGLVLVVRRWAPFWLKYLGVTADATSVTVVSIASLYNPSGGYEALVFPVVPVLYMMFNMLTALQYSVRLSLFAAVMSGLHRTGILVCCAHKSLVVLSPVSIYSQQAIGIDDQITTIFFIMVSGVLAAWVTYTAHRLLVQSAEATVRKRKLEKTQDIYRRYLSPHVRDQAIQNPESLQLGGTRRVAAVMTTQIRDFNRLADVLAPEQIVEILNNHFSNLVEIIFRHGGTLDKFSDGGMSAIFGVPNELPDGAGSAVRAALEIQEIVRELNAQREEKIPALRVGIGIAQGLVVAGNIGSRERMDYTVVGKAANQAARLQSLAHSLDADILVNAAVFDAIRGIYRADRIPNELIEALQLDSSVYRIDLRQVQLEASGPVALSTPSS